MAARSRRHGAAIALVACCLVVAGCGSTPPTVAPESPAPVATVAGVQAGWSVARFEQPAAIEARQTDAPTFCSPCHPSVGTYVSAVVAAGNGFVALGYESPPARAAAWASADAVTWRRLASFPAGDGTLVLAAVATGSGIVAVGGSGHAAAVWRSADGASWTEALLPAGGGGASGGTSGTSGGSGTASGATERATAVTRSATGLVAAGYAESVAGVRTPAFWRSADGAAWTRVPAPGSASGGSALASGGPASGGSASAAPASAASGSLEVTGLAALPGALVAVGIAGDERRGTAAAWRSADGGASWTEVASRALADGRMLAVAASSDRVVAVGENVDQTAARAWESADGTTWTAAPDQAALRNDGLQLVMTAVGGDGSGFVAVGWKTDAGNGSAAVWRSTDGLVWTRLPGDAAFSGAGMSAVLAAPRLLAAGTIGWPDTHAAAVWLPPR